MGLANIMGYYTDDELVKIGFKHIGRNVKISNKTSIYNPEKIEIGNNSRIDDFCILYGQIKIGRNVHIAPYCNIAAGEAGIVMEDFSGLAYGVNVFTQSDDYSGKTMTNPTVPTKYKEETKKKIYIGRHVIVGAGSYIFPGVRLEEGVSVGSMSLITKSTEPWKIYFGIPAKAIKNRKRDLLELEIKYLEEIKEEVGE